MLREKYRYSTEDAKGIADFLSPMLELVPDKRANAGGMANSPFMQDAKGMEKVKVDVAVGSRGEGIEGWASEIKKQK